MRAALPVDLAEGFRLRRLIVDFLGQVPVGNEDLRIRRHVVEDQAKRHRLKSNHSRAHEASNPEVVARRSERRAGRA